ncbi:TetR/AcrR family transcriptional regulator [Halobacillus naozhouensis]|uniref:TetR/AcrR family transcriptional regulator n=1 Tax=Halobacillus naozhouensis TaxID=554880 RepID=UPI00362FB6E6
MSLREKKKREVKNKILYAAEKLFKEQGFEKTTTNQIAKEAGIASGTAFNYFDTKAEILLAVFANQNKDVEDYVYSIMETEDPSEIIFNYLWHHSQQLTKIDKTLLKELLQAFVTSYKNNPTLIKQLIEIDLGFIDKLTKIMTELKDKNLIKNNFQNELAAEIIYSTLVYEFVNYAFGEDVDKRTLKDRIKQKIEFLI